MDIGILLDAMDKIENDSLDILPTNIEDSNELKKDK